MIESKVICDSIGEHSPRLVTMLARYPKFIHGEHLRHRSFSFSVSSSRAIPVTKNLEEVRSDELRASPVWWGKEQKGMSSGDELDDNNSIVLYDREGRTANYYSNRSAAKKVWERAAHDAISNALSLQKLGTHKSIVNRILEPFLHVNVLVTGTEPGWMNFFGLRLDKAAQPEIRVLAEAQRKCWNESVPNVLKPNEWHLPFIDWKEMTPFLGSNGQPLSLWEYQEDPQGEPLVIKISVARCARLSYNSFETSKRSTIEEDLALYNRLIGSSPIHASPAEHQATPDSIRDRGILGNQLRIIDNTLFPVPEWDQPKLHGNLSGWRQYRKMLAGEAIAPLPEAYR